MVEKVNPSPNRPADAFTTAGAIAYGGGADTGYVVPAGSPTELSTQDSGITEWSLNEFTQTSSDTSLSVSIDAGEAFIFGSWVVIDDSPARNVTLASSTLDQTVYVGWAKGTPNDVIVGLDSDFAADDQRIPLYEFDTDGSGVTSVTDLRNVGDTFDSEGFNTDVDARGNIIENAGHDEVDVPQVRNLTAEDWESGSFQNRWSGNTGSWSFVTADSYLGNRSIQSDAGISNEQITSNDLSAVPQAGDKIEVYFKTTDPDANRIRFAFGVQDGQYDQFKGHDYTLKVNGGTQLQLSKDGETISSISDGTGFDVAEIQDEWATFTVFWGTDGRIDARLTRLSDDKVLARVGFDDPDPYLAGNVGLDGALQSGEYLFFDDILIERREAEAAANTSKGVTDAGNELTPSGGVHTGPQSATKNALRQTFAEAPVDDGATQGDVSILTLLESGLDPAAYVERTLDGQGGAYGHQLQTALGRFSRLNANLSWEYDSLVDVPNIDTNSDGGNFNFNVNATPRKLHIDHDGSGNYVWGASQFSNIMPISSIGPFRITFKGVDFTNNDSVTDAYVGVQDKDVSTNPDPNSADNGLWIAYSGANSLISHNNGQLTTTRIYPSVEADLTIEYDGSEVRAFENGTLLGSHNDDPNGAWSPVIALESDGAYSDISETLEVEQIIVEPLPEVLN